jgi:LacI family repressor for deo operon, udp, cdd, tsx, nupC, and nupG
VPTKISVANIAARADVSPATVSRVLNHRELVKAETVRRVENAMQALNYVASAKNSGENLILVNSATLGNPFYAEVFNGILACARSHGYHILISQHSLSSSNSVNDFAGIVRSTKAKGVVLLTGLAPEYQSQLRALAPLVQCSEYNTDRFSYVSIDDFRASYKMMEHIYSTGHHKIALLNGPADYKYAKERRRGYEAFLQAMEIPLQYSWIIHLPDIQYDMAFSAISRLLTSANPPDAVFAVSDLLACATVKAAKQHAIRVPEDLVVAGFDNVEVSSISDPPITTVSQPRFQLGYTACEMLYEQIMTPNSPAQHILLDTELIIRESTLLHQSF